MTEPKQVKVRLGDVRHADYNPRKISESEMKKLMRSIEEFGFVEPVVVRPDGLLVGGHQRVAAYRRLLLESGKSDAEVASQKIPGVLVDLDEAKTKLLNLALNKISGEWDYEKLGAIFQEFDDSDVELSLSGFADGEVEDILELMATAPVIPGEVPPDGQVEPKAARKFAFTVETDDEATVVKAVLAACGMARPSEANAAFVKAMGIARVWIEAQGSRDAQAPGRAKRKVKVA